MNLGLSSCESGRIICHVNRNHQAKTTTLAPSGFKNHIENCIQSIVNQDYKGSYEIIVVDGMSNDGTYEKLQELQKKYNSS